MQNTVEQVSGFASTALNSSILTAIGNTPLLKINFDSPADIYAKLEYMNPGGSIKDRPAPGVMIFGDSGRAYLTKVNL